MVYAILLKHCAQLFRGSLYCLFLKQQKAHYIMFWLMHIYDADVTQLSATVNDSWVEWCLVGVLGAKWPMVIKCWYEVMANMVL